MNIETLEKMSTAVYLACEEPVADDISDGIKWAIGRIKELEDRCKTMVERDEVDSIIEHRDRIFAEKDATIKELQEEI